MNIETLNLSPAERRDTRSALLKAKAKASGGVVAEACPYGCKPDDGMDDLGYCRHLVGFSNDQKTYEPLVRMPNGMRRIQLPRNSRGKPLPLPEKQKGDKFVRISTSYRVYREDVPDEDEEEIDETAAAKSADRKDKKFATA